MKILPSFKELIRCFVLFLTLLSYGFETAAQPDAVKTVMDGVVTRLYKNLDAAQLDTISEAYLMNFLTTEELHTLATKYMTFEVNVPVTVSLMRDSAQKVMPFWIAKSGFKKTTMLVKNENYSYEVWEKDFDKGEVALGINGFDKNRPVYFISVSPKQKENDLTISKVYPSEYPLMTMKKGAFTYHDWDGLILTEVPPVLEGGRLFTTVRGRAREAHLVGAFRKTLFPASDNPDQLLLTWSKDPKTTMNIQWRTNGLVQNGLVKYWEDKSSDTLTTAASLYKMEDRLLQNDRYINRYTARLENLKPENKYHYLVGSKTGNWSAKASFDTEAPAKDGFSFIWFGDTHKSPIWGDMAQKALKRHPGTSFFSIAGDLVSTGLDRNEWDELWQYPGDVFRSKPLMPVPGNHDSQDGLGAGMYQAMFSLPENGPEGLPKEMTYAFDYQGALFLMIDATLSVPAQNAWIEEKLKSSKAKWKFVFFHFAPYNFVEPYDEIRREWCTLFDKYHVDMVMSGHLHYYLRTRPMFDNKPAANASKGTIYTMSVSIPGKQEEWLPEDYAVVRYPGGPLYQHISIKDNILTYQCLDPDGKIRDAFEIVK
jgi:hypothetical protein